MKRVTRQALRRQIDRLPKEDRELIELRYVDKLNMDEIAYVLDLSSSSTNRRFARAVVRLLRLCVANGIEL